MAKQLKTSAALRSRIADLVYETHGESCAVSVRWVCENMLDSHPVTVQNALADMVRAGVFRRTGRGMYQFIPLD